MSKRKPSPRPTGRPSKMTPDRLKKAVEMAGIGKGNTQISEIIGVSRQTFDNWMSQNETFAQLIREQKQKADELVEAALYRRATGFYRVVVEKVVQKDGTVQEVEKISDYMPPDVAAAKFWLMNRRSRIWKEKVLTEHSGPDGAPIEVKAVQELDDALNAILVEINSKLPEVIS